MKDRAIGARLGLGAAAVILTGLVAGAAPALAFDDRPSTFDPLLNIVGLGKDSDQAPQIDFRERPKLVVPRSADLPPPQTGTGNRAANWPQDQDIVRRRAAQAAERAPRALNANANPALDKRELEKGRTTKRDTSEELCDVRLNGIPDCSALTPAEKLKRVFTLGSGEDREVTTPGVEPDREYLTEPPKGYRKATTVVRATSGAPVRKYEAPSASDYARGVDPNRPPSDN